jgi:hypothetical protein
MAHLHITFQAPLELPESPGLGRGLGLSKILSQALGRLKPAQRPGLARPERAR